MAEGVKLFDEAFGLEEVAHEALEIADLALQVGALGAELGVALAQLLLLAQQHLDLRLLLLAVARGRVLVLLLLARAAVVAARVRLGAAGAGRQRPLLVGGRARGRGRRGARGRAVAGGLRRGELRRAVADQLLDGLQLAVVLCGHGQRQLRGPLLGGHGCGRRRALRLLRVAQQQLGGGAGWALRRREVCQLYGSIHGLELTQQLLGGLRPGRRQRRVHRRGLHDLRRVGDVLEYWQVYLLLQPVREDVFCNKFKFCLARFIINDKIKIIL